MFGIDSFGVGLAYSLSIISTVMCVVYGIINWNKGSDEIQPDDIDWAKEEEQIEEQL